MTAPTATAEHTELRYVAGKSAKFYSIYSGTFGGKARLILNWGRIGAPRGQFQVHQPSASVRYGKESEKYRKGYEYVTQNAAVTEAQAAELGWKLLGKNADTLRAHTEDPWKVYDLITENPDFGPEELLLVHRDGVPVEWVRAYVEGSVEE